MSGTHILLDRENNLAATLPTTPHDLRNYSQPVCTTQGKVARDPLTMTDCLMKQKYLVLWAAENNLGSNSSQIL